MAKSDFRFAWPFRVRYAEVDGQPFEGMEKAFSFEDM